jgi:hypothetical protein
VPFVAVHESPCGTKRTSIDVRSSVAIGGNPDVARKPHIGMPSSIRIEPLRCPYKV